MKTNLLVAALLYAAVATGGSLPARRVHAIDVKKSMVVCTPSTLMIALKAYGIANAELVWYQAMHESGELTSKLFKVNHNLFGMRLPEFRKTTAIGEHWRHAKFASWIDAVKDYKLWQLSRHITHDISQADYLRKLAKYAEDKAYIYKLKRKMKDTQAPTLI